MFIYLTVPAAPATKMWSSSCGSGIAARILESVLMGAPRVLFDLAALRAVSSSADLQRVSREEEK